MEPDRAQRIRGVLTPKRRELFDLMCGEAAAGRWDELEDGRRLITIRWMAERKVDPIYRIPERTWHEIVFVGLTTPASAPSLGRCGGPRSGRSDSDLTVTRALAVVRDPVAALGLAPVPVLRWRLAWAPGTLQAGFEELTFATEAGVTPPSQDLIVPGHGARHALDDGAIELEAGTLRAVTCRYCHARDIPGRDVVFHPWAAELVEQVPARAG